MNIVEKIIQQTISDRKVEKVVINDDGFLLGLFDKSEDGKGVLFKRLLSLLFLSGTLIYCIVIVINSFIFFISDVLLFENRLFINKEGAFVPTQSCDREYALFMFTSSDLWANTGVQVQKGDRIKIMASGAFNSSVSYMKQRAKENRKLKYNWISAMPTHIGQMNKDTVNCIYKGNDSYFGSILYCIDNDLAPEEIKEDIHQLNANTKDYFIPITKNGTLFFSVNDIYLTPQIFDQHHTINKVFANNIKESYPDSVIITSDSVLVRTSLFNRIKGDSISLYFPQEKGYTMVAGACFKNYFSQNREVWFNDNIGDILICMEIEHATDKSYAKWYRECETDFNLLKDAKHYWFLELGILGYYNLIKWPIKAFLMFGWKILILLLIFMGLYVCFTSTGKELLIYYWNKMKLPGRKENDMNIGELDEQ